MKKNNKLGFTILFSVLFLIIGLILGSQLFPETRMQSSGTPQGTYCFDKNYQTILKDYNNQVKIDLAQINNGINNVYEQCNINSLRTNNYGTITDFKIALDCTNQWLSSTQSSRNDLSNDILSHPKGWSILN